MSTEILRRDDQNHVPVLSIVIPTLNRAHVLMEGIKALRQQTMTDFELIVVDNGPSEDDTRNRLLELQQEDARVVYISTTEKGDFIARNVGCRHARAEIILTTDDDWIMTESTSLIYILQCFLEDAQIGVLGIPHDYQGVGTEKSSWKSRLKQLVMEGAVQLKLHRPGRINRWGKLSTQFRYLPLGKKHEVDHVRGYCMAFRREPAAALGFFSVQYTHGGYSYRGETELCWLLKRQGYRVVQTTEITGIHNVQPRADSTMPRGRMNPRIMYSQARSNTLFFLSNFWSHSAAPVFLFLDLFVGNFRHPGVVRLVMSRRYFGRLNLMKASLRGKWDGYQRFRHQKKRDGQIWGLKDPQLEPDATR